ncbi:hypothetical protein OIDMADRAFT_176614 [Oidiodendron maius Zn]|uniref:Uncharacterized protein n=1 Tax=Oidiodendron maius (strain Zn) TaxID=913774 RepID=A0A0C3DWR0_OIDMZ|nr:hypothetical protein OIDMADRAFT_176614 [Oidiodendron maius Zn]
MTRLIAQSPVREPKVHKGRTVTTSRSSNIEAFLAQMVGTEHATDPCTHFASSSGVFAQCVTVTGLFLGSCAKCHYGSEGARCSFPVVEVGNSDRLSPAPNRPSQAPIHRHRCNASMSSSPSVMSSSPSSMSSSLSGTHHHRRAPVRLARYARRLEERF